MSFLIIFILVAEIRATIEKYIKNNCTLYSNFIATYKHCNWLPFIAQITVLSLFA